MTTHNIRISGKDQRHNDRNFENRSEEGHIDFEKEKQNFYWHCYQNDENVKTFLDAEKKFYEENFTKSLEEQNEKHLKSRHKERIKTIDDIRTGRHTAPVESIFEIGNSENRTDGNETLDIFMELKERLEAKFKNLHIIDYALHVDEKGNDHIHWRSIISYTDEKGIRHIGQEKGLEQMGVQLPDPTKKASRHNNRKMTFDKEVREMTAEIAKELYDYDLEKSESPGGMRLDDYRSWKEAQRKVKEAEEHAQEAEDRAQEAEERADIAEERKKDAEISEKIARDNAVDWINTAEEAKKLTDEEIAKKNKKKMQKEKIENDIAELSETVDELQKKYYEFSHLIGERERNDIEKQIEDLRQGIERT